MHRTQVLKNLVTTGFKGIVQMLQVRHKLRLPVGDLKEAVDDALSLHYLLQSSHGPSSYYFQWPPVAFHHKFSTTPVNFPLAKAFCLLMWKYFCNTGTYFFEAWLCFHFTAGSTWCNRCPVGVEQCKWVMGEQVKDALRNPEHERKPLEFKQMMCWRCSDLYICEI